MKKNITDYFKIILSRIRHSRESGNPVKSQRWIPDQVGDDKKYDSEYLLDSVKNDIPERDAEVLLASLLRISRESVLAHPERSVSWMASRRFRRMVKKRKAGIPLAYLTGTKSFFGLDFFVNTYTLIPRPETELLVESAIEEIKIKRLKDYKIILCDVGTGAGCIPISIIKTSKHQNIKTIATDISKPALRVAKKNAKKHDVNITFLHGNLLYPVLKQLQHLEHFQQLQHLIVTANLPYLTQKQFDDEPTIQHEPKSALVADKDGLALYEELLKQVKVSSFLFPVSLFLEIDPAQTIPIIERIKTHLPTANVEIKKDLNGHDRVVIISFSRGQTEPSQN